MKRGFPRRRRYDAVAGLRDGAPAFYRLMQPPHDADVTSPVDNPVVIATVSATPHETDTYLAHNSDQTHHPHNMNGWQTGMKVTTAEFIKHYGRLADRALSEPLTITKNGHDRLVVLSVEEYERLKRRDRRVMTAADFTDAEIALIERAEVPAEHAHLDKDLKDWRP